MIFLIYINKLKTLTQNTPNNPKYVLKKKNIYLLKNHLKVAKQEKIIS